jgi:drug/metabolite transporter (DMT)-like permease
MSGYHVPPAMTAIPSPARADKAEHRLGVIFVAASAVGWSVSGVFARLVSVDPWTAVMLRSCFGALYMLIGILIVHRGRARESLLSIGWYGLFVALLGALSMVAFVGSFFFTSVANVSVIYSTTPFLAAGMGWLVLREAVPWRTIVASAVALAGVVIMVSGSYVSGRILGDGLAFVMAITFAMMAIGMRARPALDILPTNLVVCLMSGLMVAPFATPSSATPLDLLLLAGFAFTSIALSFFLFLAGTRRIPAAEAGLITTLEVALSPLWVFLLFSENPGLPALIGGAIVLVAVIGHILSDRSAA